MATATASSSLPLLSACGQFPLPPHSGTSRAGWCDKKIKILTANIYGQMNVQKIERSLRSQANIFVSNCLLQASSYQKHKQGI